MQTASDCSVSLTQRGAGIELPGNRSICQIQQVPNQNQPTRSMMVPEQKKPALPVATAPFDTVNSSSLRGRQFTPTDTSGRPLQPILCSYCTFCGLVVNYGISSSPAESSHPLRLLRMDAMPMTMLATDRALAAFFRANSLICCLAVRSGRNSLLVHWKRPETTGQLC